MVAVKIVVVTLFNPFERATGGIEAVVYHLSRALAKMKHEVWILTMGRVQKNTRMEVDGVNLWILADRGIESQFIRTMLFIKEGKTLIESLERDYAIDVFNGQGGLSGPLCFASLKESKRVLTVHTVDGENIANVKDCWRIGQCKESIGEALKYPILKAWRSFLFWRSDALVFVSGSARNEFETSYPHLRHIPHYVIENGFPGRDLVNSVSPKETRFDFVYAGRLDKLKGVDLIIKAAHLVNKDNSYRIAVVGDGPWRKMMENLAGKWNVKNIRFLGHLPHSSALEVMKASRCLIVPSFYESDPLVIKEGIALGVPIICSDIPSMRQTVSNYGNGSIFSCGDYQDLARTMRLMLTSQEAECASGKKVETERSRASNVCSWLDVAKEYVLVFESVNYG